MPGTPRVKSALKQPGQQKSGTKKGVRLNSTYEEKPFHYEEAPANSGTNRQGRIIRPIVIKSVNNK